MANIPIIFLDVETIPSQKPGIKEELLSGLKPPGNISRPETIAKWREEKAPLLAEKAYHDTCLDGTTGELLSITWAFNEDPIQCVIRTLDQPEVLVINPFFDVLEEFDKNFKWCVHNAKFDLSFLWKRSVILSRRPPVTIPTGRHPDVLDTMEMWAGYNGFIKFDVLCHVLGLPGKDGMDGSMVWDYVQQGRYDEIKKYNISDVDNLRQVYRRMTFMDWKPSNEEPVPLDTEAKKLEESGFFDKVLGSKD